MKTLPNTLPEIVKSASGMFEDPAVHSVNVNTAWGFEVTVFRDGDVWDSAAIIDGKKPHERKK